MAHKEWWGLSGRCLLVSSHGSSTKFFFRYARHCHILLCTYSLQVLTKYQFSPKLTVFDHLGREVKQLEHKFQEPGFHYINWDGRDQYGTNVSSGIYFYQITYDGTTQTGKMLLVK